MARLRSSGTDVPTSLRTYDHRRWEKAAESVEWAHASPTYLYWEALIDAGVAPDVADEMRAAAVVADLKRRLGADA